MPLPPPIAKGLRIALIMLGALAIMSAVVNIVAALQLLEPGDEDALGLSRRWLLTQYALQLVLGAAMIFFGFRRRKS
jgi:heme A synthase